MLPGITHFQGRPSENLYTNHTLGCSGCQDFDAEQLVPSRRFLRQTRTCTAGLLILLYFLAYQEVYTRKFDNPWPAASNCDCIPLPLFSMVTSGDPRPTRTYPSRGSGQSQLTLKIKTELLTCQELPTNWLLDMVIR